MASEYKLRLLYRAEFHDIYAEHHEHPEFGPLLQRMKVVDAQGESQMDEDQWEAASELCNIWTRECETNSSVTATDVYIGFAFEKL